jgi:PiT family inorganic phosphate transporter
MATSVGAGALTIWQALVVAAVFEFAGAFLAGGQVTATIRKGIIDSSPFVSQPEVLAIGMLAALLGAGIWLMLASWRGWPVSTTHSIVGGLVGFALIAVGADAVQWNKIGGIVVSWVASPLLAGVLAYLLFMSVQVLVLRRSDPLAEAKRYVPFYIFLVGFILSLVTLFKGLKHVGLEVSTAQAYGIATLIGIAAAALGWVVIRNLRLDPSADTEFRFDDVANAIGPVAAVISITQSGTVAQSSPLPIWVLLLGGVGIVLGLAMLGRRVIATVGKRITELTPSRGFAAEIAAASTVVLASGTGIPISTTHTLVGAVLGVGMARGISSLNLRVIGNVFMSWIITIPAGALVSIVSFIILRAIFIH